MESPALEPSIPFFKQFQKFCSNLDCEVTGLKEESQIPPGSKPRSYYNGLKTLKLEVENLKKVSDETNDKMHTIHPFGYFVHSVHELIKDQEDDVRRMEIYLEKFGYVIPEEGRFLKQTESLTEEIDTAEMNSKEETTPATIQTPELSEIGRLVLEGKELNMKTLSLRKVDCRTLNIGKKIVPVTPVQKKTKSTWYCTPTPNVSTMKKVENWLRDVEMEASFAMTPKIGNNKQDLECVHDRNLQFHSPPMEERNVYLENKTNNGLKEKCTPEEPVISSFSKLVFQEEHPSITPEEPALYTRGLAVKNKMPVVSESHTPDEPYLSALGKSFLESRYANDDDSVEAVCTPEDPILCHQTYHQPNNTDIADLDEGEGKTVPPHKSYLTELPASPLLSDITQKILNAKTLRFSDTESRSEYETDSKSEKGPELSSKCTKTQQYVASFSQAALVEPKSPELSEITKKFLFKIK